MAKQVQQSPAVSEGSDQRPLSRRWRYTSKIGLVVGVLVIVVVGSVSAFNLAYRDRILPGISADGLYVGGLTVTQAERNLQSVQSGYMSKPLTVIYGQSRLQATPTQLGVSYDLPAVAQSALEYGRQGGFIGRLHEQLRALFHRTTLVASYQYNQDKLAAIIQPIVNATASPVQNAALNGGSQVTPAQSGNRLDIGLFVYDLNGELSHMNIGTVVAPIAEVAPVISTASLQSVAPLANTYLSAPITLTLTGGATKTITPAQIAGWLQPNSTLPSTTTIQGELGSYYPFTASLSAVNVTLSLTAVDQYVAALASSVDTSPVNAQLTVNSSNQVSVFVPSSNGTQLDQAQADTAIMNAVKGSGAGRTVAVTVKTLTPAISEANLNSLGINQLISVGETTFPEGPADRLQNIAAGAAKFNNVLIAPGATFSFDTTLGPVDAATGFDAALVIANGTVTTADGGGLCQVSTTMYRAALLAGLPITARTNHSFVVSYYTSFATTNLFGPNAGQSYSADIPGLDATIYLPSPDLQFQNNTGHYILIQSQLGDGFLKFNFYGTAVQYGVIRGPYWTSSSHNTEDDATQTTFYRDVYNMSGALQHTDTVVTNYLPAAQFGE